MEYPAVIHSTFVIERTYAAKPERVFAAFADPDKKRRWFAASDSREVERFDMNFRVGGEEHSRFRLKKGGPMPGASFSNDTKYLDIVPNQRVVFAYKMSMRDQCFSASLATVELRPSETGTELIFTHQGAFFEGADGPAVREDGWRKLLDCLNAELIRHED